MLSLALPSIQMPKSLSDDQSLPLDAVVKQEINQDEISLQQEQDFRPPPAEVRTSVKPTSSPLSKRESSESSITTPSTKSQRSGPQLISDLPLAEEEAKATFTEIPDNHYQYSTLGRSREALEGMTCDCQYEPGQSGISDRYSM